jgi:hypothetical protein
LSGLAARRSMITLDNVSKMCKTGKTNSKIKPQ